MSITEQNPSRTELSELGEFGLIDRLTAHIEIRNSSTIKGIGDDAAVLDYGGKLILVTKTCSMRESISTCHTLR